MAENEKTINLKKNWKIK